MPQLRDFDRPFEEFGRRELLEWNRECGRLAMGAKWQFLATLPEIARTRAFRDAGFRSIDELAARRGAVRERDVEEVLLLHKRIGRHWVLWRLFAAGRVGMSKLMLISRHVTAENAAWWAEQVVTCNRSQLRALIETLPKRGTPEVTAGDLGESGTTAVANDERRDRDLRSQGQAVMVMSPGRNPDAAEAGVPSATAPAGSAQAPGTAGILPAPRAIASGSRRDGGGPGACATSSPAKEIPSSAGLADSASSSPSRVADRGHHRPVANNDADLAPSESALAGAPDAHVPGTPHVQSDLGLIAGMGRDTPRSRGDMAMEDESLPDFAITSGVRVSIEMSRYGAKQLDDLQALYERAHGPIAKGELVERLVREALVRGCVPDGEPPARFRDGAASAAGEPTSPIPVSSDRTTPGRASAAEEPTATIAAATDGTTQAVATAADEPAATIPAATDGTTQAVATAADEPAATIPGSCDRTTLALVHALNGADSLLVESASGSASVPREATPRGIPLASWRTLEVVYRNAETGAQWLPSRRGPIPMQALPAGEQERLAAAPSVTLAELRARALAASARHERALAGKIAERQRAGEEVPADLGRDVPAAVETYLMARSGGLCERSGCMNRAIHVHHLDPFSVHRRHDIDRMLMVCAADHDAYHSGLLVPESADPRVWWPVCPGAAIARSAIDARVLAAKAAAASGRLDAV